MKPQLKILLLEDNALDAELIAHQLEASGLPFHLSQIQTEAELRRELEAHPPDLILSDHGLPAFSGFRALQIVREGHPDLPFIFVSGSNDQGMVARMYEEGATDYVFKQDVGDLTAAVRRAVETPPETASPQATSEPNPRTHAGSATRPISISTVGHLYFCPKCRQVRNEEGAPVQVESFCGDHAEVVINRHMCSDCGRKVAAE